MAFKIFLIFIFSVSRFDWERTKDYVSLLSKPAPRALPDFLCVTSIPTTVMTVTKCIRHDNGEQCFEIIKSMQTAYSDKVIKHNGHIHGPSLGKDFDVSGS